MREISAVKEIVLIDLNLRNIYKCARNM